MQLKLIHLSKPNPDNRYSNYENQLEPQYFSLILNQGFI